MSKRHFDIQKVIIILGQTATGKSALAIKIAKKVNGQVISADSRQIYKGLDIGTGTKGIVLPEVPPNYPLRKKLAFASDRALMLKLQKLDPERAKNIDPKNKHRLIRAIEIAKTLGKVPKIKVKTLPYKFMKIG